MAALVGWLRRLEDGLLVLLMLALILVAAYQVLARNLLDGGLLWGDALVRVLVFWITMIGATVAARGDEHIRIDLLARFLGSRSRAVSARLAAAFTALVCAALAYYSIEFIRFEYEDQTIAFGPVPAWLCQLVLPLGAGLMALRYSLMTIWPVLPPALPSGSTANDAQSAP